MTDTSSTWGSLDAIAADHGPSFYLADLDRCEENYRAFLSACRALYPRTSMGYSYKTNYLPELIRRAHSLGAYSEVVSGFELSYARDLGVPGQRIIFNGPVKSAHDLGDAFLAGVKVNADSIPEIRQMIEVAARLGGPLPVGIRCYLPEQRPGSRFGVDLRQPDGLEALRAIDDSPHLRLSGLHFHHSGNRSAEPYRQRTRAMVALHREVLGGRPIDFIDIGGGFAGAMHPDLAAQLASPTASFDEYAEAVAGEMHDAYGDDGPELILEPGMALLADTMTFVTRVEAVKQQHRRLAVVDGSAFNIQPPWNILRENINVPIRVVGGDGRHPRVDGSWDVVGHTCIEADTLHRGYGGRLGIGDYILVENVGAYTNVLNAPFIRGTPPILKLQGEGKADLLRPASTARDLLRSYQVPNGHNGQGPLAWTSVTT